ncbi:MAG: 4-(cytidine 5'-diphospho)-2-C-methyl-D-erythritol kinase [Bauldia sp.]|nr:4-(cytidine 5'-diphospho)-2-C-methyl-D-erythritol kinase [Bauldia sp.]
MSPPNRADAPGIAGREAAPAKINLALHVRGRRPDGYHDLDSLVVFAPPMDEVEAAATAQGFTLAVEGPLAAGLAATAAEDNLVLRAARLMAAEARYAGGVALRLTKRLPVGAGLGGGSADAAATLRLLHRLWHDRVDAARVAALAEQLGADVPMCLQSRPLRAGGKGETLTPVAGFPALWIVLAHPAVPVGTAAVFRRLADPADPPLPPLPTSPRLSPGDIVTWLGASANGLTAAACLEAPVIGDVLQAIAAQPRNLVARMSGSGSTCFGIFPDRTAAESAAARLAQDHRDWWIVATATLPS